MSNLSDFVGGGGGGFYIGYFTSNGVYEQVADGEGVAFVSDTDASISYSLNGSTVAGTAGQSDYIAYTAGLWVLTDNTPSPQTFLLTYPEPT
jgi:hypothetical protein